MNFKNITKFYVFLLCAFISHQNLFANPNYPKKSNSPAVVSFLAQPVPIIVSPQKRIGREEVVSRKKICNLEQLKKLNKEWREREEREIEEAEDNNFVLTQLARFIPQPSIHVEENATEKDACDLEVEGYLSDEAKKQEAQLKLISGSLFSPIESTAICISPIPVLEKPVPEKKYDEEEVTRKLANARRIVNTFQNLSPIKLNTLGALPLETEQQKQLRFEQKLSIYKVTSPKPEVSKQKISRKQLLKQKCLKVWSGIRSAWQNQHDWWKKFKTRLAKKFFKKSAKN